MNTAKEIRSKQMTSIYLGSNIFLNVVQSGIELEIYPSETIVSFNDKTAIRLRNDLNELFPLDD